MKYEEDWLTVIEYCSCGMRQNPLSIKLLYNFATANERLNNFETALVFYDYCLVLRPLWSEAMYCMAVINFKRGNF